MVGFGGNTFEGSVSVPLMFGGRYFIVQPGDPPLVSVMVLDDDRLQLEVLRNEPPPDEPRGVTVSKTPRGIVTVTEAGGGFLYKVRPESETSVTFGRIPGEGGLEARIGDNDTRVIRTFEDDRPDETVMTVSTSTFSNMGGIRVDPGGGIGVGFPIPQGILIAFGS